MKLEAWFVFMTLIIGSIASHRSDEDWIRNRKLKAICYLRYPSDDESSLNRNCRHTPQEIKELDEEAGANVAILSRHNDAVVLGFEPGIYIVEGRTENGTWHFVETLPEHNDPDEPQTKWRYGMNRPANVELRFYRVFSTGLSRPETIQIQWRRSNERTEGIERN